MTRTKDQAAAVLPTLLKALRLPSINRNWKRLTDTADRDGWPAANLLASLLEIEMADRSSRRIQRHRDQSGLPAGKTFATFDFDAAPGIRKPHLLSLAAGDDWIESGGNLLLFGQSGTGKTHAVAAIGHALIDTGRRVLFCSTTDMVQKLQSARRDLSLPAMLGLSGVALGAVIVLCMSLRPQGICGQYELDEMLARAFRRRRGGK